MKTIKCLILTLALCCLVSAIVFAGCGGPSATTHDQSLCASFSNADAASTQFTEALLSPQLPACVAGSGDFNELLMCPSKKDLALIDDVVAVVPPASPKRPVPTSQSADEEREAGLLEAPSSVRADLNRALELRGREKQFTQLLEILNNRFPNWQKLAVLERITSEETDGYESLDYGFLVVAQLPTGYTALTNMPDARLAKSELIATAEPDAHKAKAFFAEMHATPLPQFCILTGQGRPSEAFMSEHSLVPETTLLHIFERGAKDQIGRAWHGAYCGKSTPGYVAAPEPGIQKVVAEMLERGRPITPGLRWNDIVIRADFYPWEKQVGSVYSRLGENLLQLTLGQQHPKVDLPLLLQRIRKLHNIEGGAVGACGSEGDSYKICCELTSVGSPEDYRKLLADDNVVARAIGMQCLCGIDWAGRCDALVSRLGGTELFGLLPGGCGGSSITEGEFAWTLLHDMGYAGINDEVPALAPWDLMALDMKIMVTDRFAPASGKASAYLWMGFDDGVIKLDMPSLRRAFPKMTPLELIKSMGRLEHEVAKPFLIKCLADKSLPLDCRLAAGSALTRFHDDEDAQAAVLGAKDELDRLSRQGVGTRFVQIVQGKIQSLQPLPAEKWPEGISPKELDAFTTRLPQLAEYESPWDTYSDVAYQYYLRLHWQLRLIVEQGGEIDRSDELTAARLRLLDKLQDHITKREAR